MVGEKKLESRLMTSKTDNLSNIAADRVIKLNASGAGNYRVQYDESSWKALLSALAKLNVEDRVNLLSDSWALTEANRRGLSASENSLRAGVDTRDACCSMSPCSTGAVSAKTRNA